MKSTADIKNFTRGGQITLHNIRMFFQIMDKVTWIALIVFFGISFIMSVMMTTAYERYLLFQYSLSSFLPFFNPSAHLNFIEPNDVIKSVRYADIQSSIWMKETVRLISMKLFQSMLVGLVISVMLFIGLSKWLRGRGVTQTEDKLITGDTLLSKSEIIRLIKTQQLDSDLILAGLPLIKNKETSHILFHGTVGSGKSTAIKELLDHIRRRGDRAIIYDKGCDFFEIFYRPERDVLLNPMDVRSEPWDLWNECRDAADFDSLAAAQIPMPLSTADPFWVNAARTIFASAAFEMRNDPERSTIKLLRYLLTSDLSLLQKYLKGTVAETLVSEKAEKTAISIKSVLATYLKSMKYIKESENNKNTFSIRQWIQDESASNCLFITSLGDRHETLKPLMTTWLDIAVNAVLSLSSNADRRIWLILDELTSLQQVPYLTQTLAESRKFGGCAVIGIQNIAQLSKLYGQDGAREISSLINTRVMFRQPDPEVAKWSAHNFGETIQNEMREGISYGADTMRDGISLQRIETRKPLISFSEIMSLNDLQAYIRLPGAFPITKLDFNYKMRVRCNMGFIARHFNESSMQDIDELFSQHEKPLNRTFRQKNQEKKKEKNNFKTIKKENQLIQEHALDI